jgi:uncharacterized protein (TIGR03435 family)
VAVVLYPPVFLAAGDAAQTNQPAAAQPAFEVASVRANNQGTGNWGAQESWGYGTGRVSLVHVPLRNIVLKAFGLRKYELVGPSWVDTECFDIHAIVPAGAPKEQIPLMFQGLLAERFKLKFHRETKTASAYALLVGAGGPKLKDAEPDPPAKAVKLVPDNASAPKFPAVGKRDMSSISATGSGVLGKFRMTMSNGNFHYEFQAMSALALAEFLSDLEELPVVDRTKLGGSYVVPLDVPIGMLGGAGPPPGEGGDANNPPAASVPYGTSITASLQKLGLQLVRQQLPLEKFVIDHIERVPTEN